MHASEFICLPGSVGGPTTGGVNAYPSIVRWIRDMGWRHLRVLDVCCGVGTLGLLTYNDVGPEGIADLVLSDLDMANVESARATAAAHGWPVTCLVSDGLQQIPSEPPFDLIVSNPPHYLSDGHHHSADHDWRFHRYFFSVLHTYLSIGGEAWLIEAADGGTDALAATLVDKDRIAILSYETEPNDPPFSWLKLRRVA